MQSFALYLLSPFQAKCNLFPLWVWILYDRWIIYACKLSMLMLLNKKYSSLRSGFLLKGVKDAHSPFSKGFEPSQPLSVFFFLFLSCLLLSWPCVCAANRHILYLEMQHFVFRELEKFSYWNRSATANSSSALSLQTPTDTVVLSKSNASALHIAICVIANKSNGSD